MMNQDKKSILQEIEVLIRSIKVHYDNLENESRIPSIELELITSKIRKLHEKSIIYNHLHYLEEEQNQILKRLRQEEEKSGGNGKTTMPTKITVIESPVETIVPKEVPVSPPPVQHAPPAPAPTVQLVQETPEIKPPAPQPTAPPAEEFKKVSEIVLGLNDRIWLTRELFENNADELNLAVNTLKNTASQVEFNQQIQRLKAKFSWKDEEAEEAFKSLFRPK